MSKKLLIGLITALFIVIAVVFIYFKFFTISENKPSSTTSKSRISTSQSSQSSTKKESSEDSSSVTTNSTSEKPSNETGKPSDQAEGKEQIRARSTVFDFNAMTHGNFTSVKGTWKNAEGQTITFDEKGIVADETSISSFNYDAAGNLIVNVQTGLTGYSIWFVMKGNAIVPEGDTSQGKNRKLKAVFLKRYDGVGNNIPGLGGNDTDPSCPSCPDNSDVVCEVSKSKVKTLPISVKLPEGADKKDIKFKLFNSSKQQYEGEFTLDENGKLPALELFEKNSYFLQLVSNKYFMHNKHFEAVKEGKFPFAFKDKKELTELVVKNNTSNVKNDGTYEIDIKFVKDNKALVNEEIQFISAIHTTKATTDELGHLKVRLMEDVTYVAKPTNENLIIDTFPIVVKDKTEWGTPGIKYIFDHSSCGSAEIIKVKNKISGRTNGSITCKPGNTTIKGMDFKNLFLLTDHLDKSDYPELKEKDAMILDLVLLNHVRQNCERTKLAYGDFEILRKIPTGKKVSSAYYLNGNNKEELKFEQIGDIVKITDVHSLGIYPLVIEFEKTGLDIPNKPDENKDEEITLIDEQTKISVKGPKKILEGLKLKVNKPDSNKFESLRGKNVNLYDIEFLDKSGNLKKVENGKFLVTVPKTSNDEVVAVHYLDDNGKLNALSFNQNGKEISFETSHFSKYAIEYKFQKVKDDKQIENNNKKQSKKSKLAKTSIGLNFVTLSTLAISSLAGLYISKKKR